MELDEMSVSKAELKTLTQELLSGDNLLAGNIDVLKDLKIKMQVSLGETEIQVDKLMTMKEGSVVKLDREANSPLDIFINGKLVARGVMVVVDDDFGVQITEISS
ncbi:flagellar motor switch FliN [gamma proteobacterium IMCC1989]|nr:flagellar motor switch FliN [gamma proteobacterium IMCC1989]